MACLRFSGASLGCARARQRSGVKKTCSLVHRRDMTCRSGNTPAASAPADASQQQAAAAAPQASQPAAPAERYTLNSVYNVPVPANMQQIDHAARRRERELKEIVQVSSSKYSKEVAVLSA